MGFLIAGTVLGNWLGEKPKKKIHVLQKVIDDLNKEIRMRFSIAGAVLGNWLAERSQKKRIHVLEKVIVDLNKALESISKNEKESLEKAAYELMKAGEHGGTYGYKSTHLQMKEMYEELANYLASWRQPLLDELVLFERLKKIEIEALQDRDFTTQKTRQICFLF